ncbi:MAG: peptidylprolyl isomerase [Abitibacteriaceae bacterium]|nr:peptidylprolyl isomerase [Abditibacteriaceae bacterium]
MKRLLTSLPLTLVLIGCGAPTTQDVSANSSTNTATTSSSTASSSTTSSSTTSAASDVKTDGASGAKAADTKDTTTDDAPEAAYKVVDEAQPGMPPEVAAELKKVAVPPPPAKPKAPEKARVQLQTSQGPITVELDGKAAPMHVKSFLYLAQRGFYNGTMFHRYEPGFVIQGGDPLTKNPKMKDYFGMGGPGYQVPREFNGLKHDTYAFAMARSQDPDSAGSQFYITLAPAHFLDEGYTVFGKVIKGQENVQKLRKGDTLKSVTVLK